MYLFPVAAVRSTTDLVTKTTQIYSLTLSRSEVRSQSHQAKLKVLARLFPCGGFKGRIHFLAFFSF